MKDPEEYERVGDMPAPVFIEFIKRKWQALPGKAQDLIVGSPFITTGLIAHYAFSVSVGNIVGFIFVAFVLTLIAFLVGHSIRHARGQCENQRCP